VPGPGRAEETLLDGTAIATGQERLGCIIRTLLDRHPDGPDVAVLDRASLLTPDHFSLFTGDCPSFGPADVPARAAARPRVAGTDTSLAAADPADRWPHLDAAAGVDWPATAASAARFGPALERAFALLDEVQPHVAARLRATVRVVVTFAGDGPNSFATLSAHGAVFLNRRPGDDLAYAVEELAHQGGHVLLTTMLFGAEHDCFVVPPEAPLVVDGAGDPEGRTVLVTLHAVYTEALMTGCLWGALQAPGVSAAERHELRGRLGYILCRFRHDLIDLLSADVLSARGRRLADGCRRVYDTAVGRWAPTAPRLDLSGQPYAFDRRVFLRRNPTPPSPSTTPAPPADGGPPPVLR
jgi:hypothetical protein